MPYQLGAEPRGTGTDANAIQLSRGGKAAALISIPLRYMHTPTEVLSLKDLDLTVKLLTRFVLDLESADRLHAVAARDSGGGCLAVRLWRLVGPRASARSRACVGTEPMSFLPSV